MMKVGLKTAHLRVRKFLHICPGRSSPEGRENWPREAVPGRFQNLGKLDVLMVRSVGARYVREKRILASRERTKPAIVKQDSTITPEGSAFDSVMEKLQVLVRMVQQAQYQGRALPDGDGTEPRKVASPAKRRVPAWERRGSKASRALVKRTMRLGNEAINERSADHGWGEVANVRMPLGRQKQRWGGAWPCCDAP